MRWRLDTPGPAFAGVTVMLQSSAGDLHQLRGKVWASTCLLAKGDSNNARTPPSIHCNWTSNHHSGRRCFRMFCCYIYIYIFLKFPFDFLISSFTKGVTVFSSGQFSAPDTTSRMVMADKLWMTKVNLHEAFWTDDECLIVMDLAHGGNLFDKLHNDIVSNQADPFPGLGSSAGMWEINGLPCDSKKQTCLFDGCIDWTCCNWIQWFNGSGKFEVRWQRVCLQICCWAAAA